jgi:group I intron endonuclease
MASGIYKIINIKTGKFYLGSSNNIKKRWKIHKSSLRHNRHHSIHLQRAWNKYGENSFKFELVEEITENLLEIEQNYLDKLKPYETGYNTSKVAGGGDMISYHPNKKKIIKKRSETILERNIKMTSKERKEKWSKPGKLNPNWRGGKTLFKCPICGRVIKKHNKNQLSCAKCRVRSGNKNPFYGKTHSKETKKKLKLIMKLRGNKFNIQKIKVQINNVIYDSFTDAAKKLDCAIASIRNRLNNPTKFPNYKLITPQ